MRISLPAPTFAAHQVGGTEYQQIFMEGAGETGDIGKPGLPFLKTLFAVPLGADVAVSVGDTNGFDLPGVSLYPHQPEPVDQDPTARPPRSTFQDDPFVLSRADVPRRAARSRRRWPAQAARNMRDLRIGGLDSSAPSTRRDRSGCTCSRQIDVTVQLRRREQGHVRRQRDSSARPGRRIFARNYDARVDNCGRRRSEPATSTPC